MNEPDMPVDTPLDRVIRFCLDSPFVVTLVLNVIALGVVRKYREQYD